MSKKTVVIGILGSQLDGGHDANRWANWRPTVALCQHEDLLVDRLELLYGRNTKSLAETVADDIRAISPETDVRRHAFDFRDPWDLEEVYGKLHQFALDYDFDLENERYLIHITTGTHVAQICFFLLTESRHFPGQLVQAAPARRKQADPSGSYRIIDLDLSRFDKLAQRFAIEKRDDTSFLKSGIETRNNAFNQLIDQIERVAVASRSPILLTGPTGAGKTKLARKIFELKQRKQLISGSFVEANCATLQGDQARSTLFGHKKGAFTGAMNDRDGLLKSANNGMLFLDEIGELGLDEQAMLLRAIEEGRFHAVGADQETRAEFQLIAGTNRDLVAEVAAGRFREDLLARIDLWTFRLPGLKDRREDIEPNLAYELRGFAAKTGRNVRFNKEAQAAFLQFAKSSETPWTGNFRNLSAAVTRMATLSQAGRITTAEVEQEKARLCDSWSKSLKGVGDQHDLLSQNFSEQQLAELDLFDQLQLREVLRVCRESKTMAAAGRTLFNVSRTKRSSRNDADRLRKYLAKFGLSWNSVQSKS